MHTTLAIGLFAVLLVSTLLGLDVSLAPGLSVKNAFLYVIIGLMVIKAAIARDRLSAATAASRATSLTTLHVMFLLLIAYCSVSLTTVVLGGGYALPQLPGGASTRTVVISIKNQVVDQYLFLLAFAFAAQSVQGARRAIYVVMGLVAASNLLTVIDVFNIPDLGLIQQKNERVQGPLGEHSQYGAYIAVFLPGIAAAAISSKGITRLLFAIGTLVSLMALLMTASRGAMLGLLLGALVTLIVLRKHISMLKAMRLAVVCLIVGVLALTIVATQFSDLLEERFIEQSESVDLDALTSARSTIWSESLVNMGQHTWSALVGYGWGAFDANSYYASHNTYLDYFYDLGLIGLLLYLGIWLAIVRICRNTLDEVADRETRITIVAFVFGLMALLIAIFFVNLVQAAPYVWSYAGMVLALCRHAVLQSATSAAVPIRGPAGRPGRTSWASDLPIAHKVGRH